MEEVENNVFENNFYQLPIEVLAIIVNLLNVKQRLKINRTCKFFYQLTSPNVTFAYTTKAFRQEITKANVNLIMAYLKYMLNQEVENSTILHLIFFDQSRKPGPWTINEKIVKMIEQETINLYEVYKILDYSRKNRIINCEKNWQENTVPLIIGEFSRRLHEFQSEQAIKDLIRDCTEIVENQSKPNSLAHLAIKIEDLSRLRQIKK